MKLRIPVLFSRAVITPKKLLPIKIGSRNEKKLVLKHHQSKQHIGLIYKRGAAPQRIGCFAGISKLLAARSGGFLDVLTQGATRFKVLRYIQSDSLLFAEVTPYVDYPILRTKRLHTIAERTKKTMKRWALGSHFQCTPDTITSLTPFQLSYFPPALPFFSTFEQQILLEMRSVSRRLSLIESRLQESLYKHMLTEELSEHISKKYEEESILN